MVLLLLFSFYFIFLYRTVDTELQIWLQYVMRSQNKKKTPPRSLRLNRISHFTLENHSLLRKLDIASTVRAINWISRRQMRMELSPLFCAKYNVSNERSLSNCTAQSDTQIRHRHRYTYTHSNVWKGWVHICGIMLKVVKPHNIPR